MMDQKAFYRLSSGLYLLSSTSGGKDSGCIVNTVLQVTSQPAQLSVTVNKDNFTQQIIAESGVFSAVALNEQADMGLIGEFGFKTSREVDKFDSFPTKRDGNGVPYVAQKGAARFSCKVVGSLDVGTHVIFVGQVQEAEVLEGDPMTYAYYQQVKKGGTPKNAPSYKAPEAEGGEGKRGYRCKVCGYILESDTIPEGFVCPICGQGPDKLEKL